MKSNFYILNPNVLEMDRWLKTGSLKRKLDGEKRTTDTGSQDETLGSSNEVTTESLTVAIVDINDSTITINEVEAEKTIAKRRNYDRSYLEIGFTYCGDKISPRPQCVLCHEILQNSSMFPAKLRRHFDSKHSEYKDKPLSFFERKLNSLVLTKNNMQTTFKTNNENALMASLKVSYRIASQGKAHTIGENLIKPCAVDMATLMINEEAGEKIKLVPLSDNTVQRRIQDCALNILNQLVQRLRLCDKFALQLDESTDVANFAILLVFVRYIYNGELEEDILFCKPLETHTTGTEIFKVLDQFMRDHQIIWSKCIDVCTDGAKAMTGKTSGVVSRIKSVSKECSSSHCVLHRQSLACKNMPVSLKLVLDQAVQIINFIKARALNTRLFRVICNDMGSRFQNLLFHTEVRWLSRGKALVRLFQMREEVLAFFSEQKSRLAECISDLAWLHQLAYLADIFTKLNELNLSMQGRSVTVLMTTDKIAAIKLKIEVWIQQANQYKFETFENLNDYLTETSTVVSDVFKENVVEHLTMLKKSFQEYFPNKDENFNWLRNPFLESLQIDHLPIKEREQLIDINTDSTLKQKFSCTNILSFWAQLAEEYPDVSNRAVKKLLPFSTTYLCESGFSQYCATKTKCRNRLNAEDDMRLQLSQIIPDFKAMSNSKQAHCSH